MWFVLVVLFLLLVLGIIQKVKHQKNIDSIPIIINVNGTRGKTTVTRLITGMLKEADLWVIGKTSGTSEGIIYWDAEEDEEEEIHPRRRGSLITDQLKLTREAAQLEADALVCECKAIDPDEQKLFQNQLLQGNIGVITNVYEDHLDVMGPTLDQVAEAYADTIPHEGFLVVTDGPYVDYFKQIALLRDTEVLVVDQEEIDDDLLDQFAYFVLPENVALALGVAKILEIDEDIAIQGMLNAAPDPGALRIIPLAHEKNPSYFVNGFAASDATSALDILDEVEYQGYETDNAIVIMNCHPDRPDVTKQFATEVLPELSIDKIILIGKGTSPLSDAFEEGVFTANEIYDCENVEMEQVLEILEEDLSGQIIIGLGNFNDVAEELIHLFDHYKMTQRVR